jgi:hypothetical protein
MKEYEAMIKNLENRVTELEKQLFARAVKLDEPVKWEPKGGDWRIDIEGDVFEFANNEIYFHFGTARHTKQQAERAAVEMRRFNRLLALRDELCGDEVVNWRSNDSKFHIHFHTTDKIWFVGLEFQCQFIMPYFTSQEAAQKACDMLNSGEVVL